MCLASGPSLTIEDVTRLRGQAPVIAVNDAIRMAPWADVLYSSDRLWWAYYKGAPGFVGERVGVGTRPFHANVIHGINCAGIHVLQNTGETGLELDPSGLRTGKHSGYAAINLAIHYGARRILLLGYQGGRLGGRDHFFGEHPAGLNRTSDPLYHMFRRAYLTMLAPLAELGVDVINVTPESAIDTFPRSTLRAELAVAEEATC